MKSIFAFFVLNIAFITTMFAQINPYTNFRFYSDTRFIKDWGFCVAIPESMVESSDPRVQLLFKMDRGFEDKYSGSMVLLKFYDWDGKSTAQQITDLDNPEPYRKCIIGTSNVLIDKRGLALVDDSKLPEYTVRICIESM